jgi:hypothetical protein
MYGFKVAYSHEWTESVTDRDTTRISIPAGYMGRIYHAREMERVSGQYELHFGKRFYDHYYWYVPMSVTSPKTDGRDSVTTKEHGDRQDGRLLLLLTESAQIEAEVECRQGVGAPTAR